MSTPTLQPSARPSAPAPIIATIPDELRERPQWVVWRYEERQRSDGSAYWTKVPYVPGELRKARSNRLSTWRSFAAALAAYEQNPIGLDGIGYMFLASDPYIGGDLDHCLTAGQLSDFASEHLPVTYAEISPSGSGVKFIARAVGDYGRKTARGELYSHGRFFTITGHVLDSQHAQIADQQVAVDAFAAALGTSRRSACRSGTANGERAKLAAAIPPDEWANARQLLKVGGERLMCRVKASAREGTQLALALAGEYAEFDRRWPFVGLFRGDGSLDESQVRAVVANGLRGRGFSFAEYAAAMQFTFGQAKPSAELWRQELAALWDMAPLAQFVPQRTARTPDPVYRVPTVLRGRAGDHTALRERIYQQLLDHRIGTEALVKTTGLASSVNVDRRTVARVLAELRDAGRIVTRRLSRDGGLVVTFLDVIYSPVLAQTGPDLPGTACNLDVIYSSDEVPVSPMPAPETTILDGAPHEETSSLCVSSDRADDHSTGSLLDLVAQALAELPRERPDRSTGEIKRWRRSRQRIIAWLEAHCPQQHFTDAQLDPAIEQARRDEKLADLATMKPGVLKAEIRQAEHLVDRSRELGDESWRWWEFYRDRVRRELASRPPDPKRPKGGYKPCEAKPNPREVAAALQTEMWGGVAEERVRRPIPSCTPVAVKVAPAPVEPVAVDYAVVAAGIAGRLKARLEAAHGEVDRA